jgi:hypothetical protein
MVSFTPRSLYPLGKISWYPMNTRMGEPQSQSGNLEEEENLLSLQEI